MTIRNSLALTSILILSTTLVFWCGFLLTLLGITDSLKNVIGAGGPVAVVYGMILGPVIGLITAASAWKRQARQP